jgi:hypothetical protein
MRMKVTKALSDGMSCTNGSTVKESLVMGFFLAKEVLRDEVILLCGAAEPRRVQYALPIGNVICVMV